MPKKAEREDPLGFFNIHFVAQCRKKIERGDPLVSPGNVLRGKKKKNLFRLVPWANR